MSNLGGKLVEYVMVWRIDVDFFLKKTDSWEVRIFIQTLFSVSGVPEKINHFLLSIFSVMINSKLLKFYATGVDIVHTKGRI